MEKKYRIGYIDENINQVKKYQRDLRPFGFEVIGYEFEKKMSPESLMQQVYESDIDLLMIDYKLKETNVVGFNGDVIEDLIYHTKPMFPHIIFTSDTSQAEANIEDWKIIFDKDIFLDETKDQANIKRFVRTLKGSIEQYRSYVNTKKEALSALLEKGEKEGLSVAEKNEALTLQGELKSLDRSKNDEVPKQLVSIEKLEDLSKSRREAEEYLKTLMEKNDGKG